jgi:hypothetical protein
MIGQPGRIYTPDRLVADVCNEGLQPYNDHRHLALAHYFTKSKEEWIARRAQGRPSLPADHPDAIRGLDQFHAHDKNDVEDRTVANVLDRSRRAGEWAASGHDWMANLQTTDHLRAPAP